MNSYGCSPIFHQESRGTLLDIAAEPRPASGWAADQWATRRTAAAVPHGKGHQGNLLDLIDDDLLGNAPQLRLASIAQFRLGHVDRTLMVNRGR
jgi:hypothetical protein